MVFFFPLQVLGKIGTLMWTPFKFSHIYLGFVCSTYFTDAWWWQSVFVRNRNSNLTENACENWKSCLDLASPLILILNYKTSRSVFFLCFLILSGFILLCFGFKCCMWSVYYFKIVLNLRVYKDKFNSEYGSLLHANLYSCNRWKFENICPC